MLLDTHVWVWSQESPEKLGRCTRRLLVANEHVNAVSPVSSLELARLVTIGEIALEACALPGRFHPDPADRILVATARCHSLRLVTADTRILEYADVPSLDARR